MRLAVQTTTMAVSVFLAVVALHTASVADIPIQSSSKKMKVFYTKSDAAGWDVIRRGIIHSIGANIDIDSADLSQTVQDRSKATVRLSDSFGVKPGDILYVVNGDNLIIAKLTVKQVFKSLSFGHMAICIGNLRLVNIQDRVVQRVTEEYSKFAFIYKSRGDYFKQHGKTGEAIEQYKNAIEIDRRNPEAHLALGSIYLEMDLLKIAMKEFDEGYRDIQRMYDKEDRYLLLKGLVDTRYRSLSYAVVPVEARKKIKADAIKFAKEALSIYQDSKDMHFLLGVLYAMKPNPMDAEAKHEFLKVIELDPEMAEAYVNLSALYHKHNNNDKAKNYAAQALGLDPTNARARHIMTVIGGR